ncbi:hypothetical protein AX17_005091 [Amanita inopinata Kibby_2008]|nr:hypothetical protein AX17_005091 [Amanita inopinata Kibby_2008]
MALSKHVDAARLVEESYERRSSTTSRQQAMYSYGGRYGTNPVPKYHITQQGMKPQSAYRLVHDELSLDGSPVLNLASFVQTWMPPEADKLVQENIAKNLIDTDEYPATQTLHTRCISILADLWHAPSAEQAIGTATTGSSEAVQLGGLAMKKIWQNKRKAAGKSIHEPGPNIVMGANAQVALEKFARYFDVECRLVPISAESRYRLDPKKAMEYVDENTIGVFVILGSTYTGHYEPVKEMSDYLDEYEAKTGHSVPIHVDAASGGFIAPFVTPHLVWDFRLPRVVSINTSGHKFGLAYVGVGWVVWRDKLHLPQELVFELHYLGSVEYSFSLNFSRPAAPIIAQYFNFLHLGFEGYRAIALDNLKNARMLSRALEKSGYFAVLSDIHRKPQHAKDELGQVHVGRADTSGVESYEAGLPVVAFRFSDEFIKENPEIQQNWIQSLLRVRGWIVPNYELAPDLQAVQILRVVVRENVTEVLLDQLLSSIVEVTEQLVEGADKLDAMKLLDVTHAKGKELERGRLEQGYGSKPSGTKVSPTLARTSTNVLPLPEGAQSFIITAKERSYKHQYANIYFVRLRFLRQYVEQRAAMLWKAAAGDPISVPRVLEVTKGQLCYIIGTVYMDMPLKPNVLEDIARDRSLPAPPPLPTFYSEDDNIMLEDESGRIKLVGERLKDARLVTGVVIGALGMETPNGDFEAVDFCFPEMAPQAAQEKPENDDMDVDSDEPSSSGDWIAVVSGLDISSPVADDAKIQMLIEYLTGEAGGVDDQISSAQISRLIIAGNSLTPILEPVEPVPERKARRQVQEVTPLSPHPILNLSAHLYDIGQTMPIHILPGETDPSGILMPQQAFPRAMFGEVSKLSTFYRETNPTYLRLQCGRKPSVARTMLINSGQPLNDIFKYLPSPPNTRLAVLESTLRWRHMAPTAPDTLWCHPYFTKDPFLMNMTPDIYIVGGQERFGTRLVKYENDGRAMLQCRIVTIPSFSETGTLVLINVRTLDVKTVKFTTEGMGKVGKETEEAELSRSPTRTASQHAGASSSMQDS